MASAGPGASGAAASTAGPSGLTAAGATRVPAAATSAAAAPTALTRAGRLKISKAWYDKFSRERWKLEQEAHRTPLIDELLRGGGLAHACLGSTKPMQYLEGSHQGGWWAQMNEWANTVGFKPGWRLLPSLNNEGRPDELDMHDGLLSHDDDLTKHVGQSMGFYREEFGVEGDITPADMLHRHVLPFLESEGPEDFDTSFHINRISMGLGYGMSGKDYQEKGLADPDLAGQNRRMQAYVEERMAPLRAKSDGGFFAPDPPWFIMPERPDIKELVDRYVAESAEIQDAFIALAKQPEARGMDREGLVICAILGQIFNDPPGSPAEAGSSKALQPAQDSSGSSADVRTSGRAAKPPPG